MKNILIISMVSVLLSGCLGSFLEPKKDPTVFYIMTSDANAPKRDIPEKVGVNFLPVSVPSYMARTQIVTRTSTGSVDISEFSRWAELPNSGFVRVLSDNISSASKNLEVYPYPAVSGNEAPLVLRVYINECVGELSKNLLFKGQYSIGIAGVESSFIDAEFAYEIPCGANHGEYVKAIDTAMAKLAAEISSAIETFIKGKKQ